MFFLRVGAICEFSLRFFDMQNCIGDLRQSADSDLCLLFLCIYFCANTSCMCYNFRKNDFSLLFQCVQTSALYIYLYIEM